MSQVSSDFFSSALEKITGPCTINKVQSQGGGCINQATKLYTSKGDFFIKWNSQSPPDMFEKETKGLTALKDSEAVSVPKVLDWGRLEHTDYLILELLEPARTQGNYWEKLGHDLASLHREENEWYGLEYDNYIGRLVQFNSQSEDWIDFFVNQRLKPQLQLAEQKGLADLTLLEQFDSLILKLPDLLPDYVPSLLHGDLWSGNFMTGPDGYAWLIDPAIYYGNREIELAFTKLFGGFDQGFYQAYHESYALEPEFEDRVDIYNLYPLLVHVNLFGSSYLSGIRQTLSRYD